jgi:hypothetical protein
MHPLAWDEFAFDVDNAQRVWRTDVRFCTFVVGRRAERVFPD